MYIRVKIPYATAHGNSYTQLLRSSFFRGVSV